MILSDYKHITSHSKKVEQGSVFFSFDNNTDNIKEAIINKASLIVSTIDLNLTTSNLVVKNIKYFFSYWYKQINQIDLNKFTIIGITGTDGKTTTAKMIYDTITEKYKAIYIGTLGIISSDYELETKNTTPDIETILETFKYAKENKIKYIIIECSSEGLMNNRLTGIRFDVVVFTNLSHEHLNSHKTMDSYFNCKKRLIKLLKTNAVVISNQDDLYGRNFFGKTNVNYGLHKGKIHSLFFWFKSNTTYIFLVNNNNFFYYKIPFVGVYNIYNFLATHATISSLFDIKSFTFSNIKPPKGRFLVVDENIIIDFAHTPNALENLLLTLNEVYMNKHIILVLGAQGGKDKTKRKVLGTVANKYAKTIILTSEDPKNENVLDILLDISLGITKCNYIIEIYRKKAIVTALSLRTKNNVVVIVGKGLEESEVHKSFKIKHNDYDCVLNYLNIKHNISNTL